MPNSSQEQSISKGFSNIYEHYEYLSRESIIDKTMRQQVYSHINKYLKSKSNILELNAGSGIDAVYFAKKNHHVTATDIAEKAAFFLNQKIKKLDLKNLSFINANFTDLKQFKGADFNYVFSNFGGINCTNAIDKIAFTLSEVLPSKAHVTFVVMGKYYPWDWIYVLKGKFKRAFIRLQKEAIANVEGESIKTYYYTPEEMKSFMTSHFEYVTSENLASFYPSVNHKLLTKYNWFIKMLIKIDSKMKHLIPIGVGDYFIITFRKK